MLDAHRRARRGQRALRASSPSPTARLAHDAHQQPHRHRRRSRAAAPRAWLDGRWCSRTTSSGACCRLGRARPGADSDAQPPSCHDSAGSSAARRSLLPRLRHARAASRFTEMEYAIPREHAAEAVRAVRAVVEDARLRRAGSRSRCGSSPPDDAFLSPAGGRETCYIAVAHVRGAWSGSRTSAPSRRSWSASAAGRTGASGTSRPPRRCAPRYPRLGPLRGGARSGSIPKGRFTNDYVERVLGRP